MKRPFVVALGLVLVAAAPAAYVGPLYEESATSCGSLLRPSPDPVCDLFEQRRWASIAVLVFVGLALMCAGRFGAPGRPPGRADVGRAAAAGLLVIPVAAVIMFLVAIVGYAVNGVSQAFTGLPYIFAPAALALGALVSAKYAQRSGTDTGVALAAAAGGLPLVFAVQAVAEARRYNVDEFATPLLLTATFANSTHDTAALVTLALAALPVPFLLGWAAWSGRRMPAVPGAVLLFLSALIAGLLFEGSVTFRWLPLVLVPTVAAVFAVLRYAVPATTATAGAAK